MVADAVPPGGPDGPPQPNTSEAKTNSSVRNDKDVLISCAEEESLTGKLLASCEMEHSNDKKKKCGFRPAPEMHNFTLVDIVSSRRTLDRQELIYSHQNYQLPSRNNSQLNCYSDNWDEEIETLADNYQFSSRTCKRSRRDDKIIRAQKQISEKHYRSRNWFKKVGGQATKRILVKNSIKKRNIMREEQMVDAVATRKANIERVVETDGGRRGPPQGYTFISAASCYEKFRSKNKKSHHNGRGGSRAHCNASRTVSKHATSNPVKSSKHREKTKPAKYELKEDEVSRYAVSDEEAQFFKVLVLLQHRDVLPEDYDLLLQLDEKVSKKTVAMATLNRLRTRLLSNEDISENCAFMAGTNCSVCMDCYHSNQVVKWLPCDHVFHEECIDMWLGNMGSTCPLDGLQV